MVRRDNDDGVDVAVFEHATEVAEGLRLVPADLLDFGGRAVEMGAVDVVDGADAHIGVFEELAEPAHALRADADHSEHDLVAWQLPRRNATVQRAQRQAACNRSEEDSPGDWNGRHPGSILSPQAGR